MHRKRPTSHIGPLKPSDYFREQAKCARRFASSAETSEGRVAWRMIAQHWQRLVMEAKSPPPRLRIEAVANQRPLRDEDVRAHL